MPKRQHTNPDYEKAVEGPEKGRDQMRQPGAADRAKGGKIPAGGREARERSQKPRTGRTP